MDFRPLNTWVLVRLHPEDEKTKGGLIKPQGANEHVFRTGTVLRVGPGEVSKKGKRIPVDVEAGERIVFVKFVATHTETAKRVQRIIGKDEALISEQDILLSLGPDVPDGSVGR